MYAILMSRDRKNTAALIGAVKKRIKDSEIGHVVVEHLKVAPLR